MVIGEPKIILDKTLLQTIQPPARLKIKANTQAAIEKKNDGYPQKEIGYTQEAGRVWDTDKHYKQEKDFETAGKQGKSCVRNDE